MDKIKRRRRKAKAQKKLLLSTVDPWDVRVASVDPESLAKRRGVSLSSLAINLPNDLHSPGSFVSTPSPWYKPKTSSPRSQSPHRVENDQGVLTSPEWPLPWYKPLRSPTIENFRDSTQSVPPLKPPRQRGSSQGKRTESLDSVDEGIERNLNKFVETNGKDRRVGKGPIVEVHFEDEKKRVKSNGVKFNDGVDGVTVIPEIVVSAPVESEIPILTNGESPDHPGDLTDGTRQQGASENHPLGVGQGENKNSIESIVEELVKARYSPQTARQRRLNRPSSRSPPGDEVEGKIDKPLTEANTSTAVNLDTSVEDSKSGKRIRKTSYSMPDRLDNMNDLDQTIRQQQGTSSRFRRHDSDSSVTFSNSGSTPRGSPLDSDTDDDVNDEELAKVPLQAPPRRKATVVPMSSGQKLNKETLDTPGGQSTNSTITSVNSISSLLKEKLQLSIPQALRSSKRQQNADYRLKAFVGVLFLSIVFLVGFAHIYYNKHVLQRAYFEQFRFNKNDRVMRIYSRTGAEIIAARLGEGIIPETGVFPCLPHHQRSEDTVCLEWKQQARLYLAHTQQDDMHCYHVTWQSLSPSYNPTDCFDWSSKRAHWYGAGQTQNMAYPLEEGDSALEMSAFVTGDIRRHSFGNVLKRYFLNSKGATILIDPETPLYVSINANRTKDFCIQAKHDSFAYINHLTLLPQLNYTVCASDNMQTLHSLMTEKSLWDGLKREDTDTVTSLLTEPVWQIPPINEAVIYNYTQAVIDLGFLQGHVLLSEEWQSNSGDFDLDRNRFPSMEETIDMIQRRGFKVVFSVQPFISTESVNFKEAVANRLLISERGSDPRIPALTRYKQSNSAAILDITNNRTIPWLQNKLQSLVETYKVDSFYLDLGNAYDMPHYYKCQKPLTNPDHYKTLFTQAILGLVPVIGVSGAITRPRAPVFVSLPPFSSSWKAIKTVIPTVLSYGIIGYPFIMPGAVGGDIALPMSDNNPNNDYEVNLPDKELYVRWLQLSTFLPVVRFTHLPSKYSDESVLEMAKKLNTLRNKIVTPRLNKYASEALESGLPIIRPLWMLDPSDPQCHVVVDEFSIGDELIVAPILYSGSRQREVYLPAGVWRDGIDGSLRKGSRYVHNYRVSEDQVAYFVKMPDNTRF